MSRARTFTRGEILDAARAAAENGLSARLLPSGEIVFNDNPAPREQATQSPEAALEAWLNGSKVGRRAHR